MVGLYKETGNKAIVERMTVDEKRRIRTVHTIW